MQIQRQSVLVPGNEYVEFLDTVRQTPPFSLCDPSSLLALIVLIIPYETRCLFFLVLRISVLELLDRSLAC